MLSDLILKSRSTIQQYKSPREHYSYFTVQYDRETSAKACCHTGMGSPDKLIIIL